MKLLVAIEAHYPKKFADNCLRWVGRGGYALRIFIPKHKQSQFEAAIDEVNYQFYLDVRYDQLDSTNNMFSYARRHDFDLLLVIPESLLSWQPKLRFADKEIYEYVDAVGKARIEFGQHPHKKLKRFSNGAIMYRVSKL